MAAERQLATTSPGTTPKRNSTALERADEIMSMRKAVAGNIQKMIDLGPYRGDFPALRDATGLAINTIKRALGAKGSATIDTLYLLAAAHGLEVTVIFQGLEERHMHLLGMLTKTYRNLAELEAKT